MYTYTHERASPPARPIAAEFPFACARNLGEAHRRTSLFPRAAGQHAAVDGRASRRVARFMTSALL